MSRDEILKGIVEILSTLHTIEKEHLDTVTEETDLIHDLGIPSSELVSFAVKAEEYFKVEFDDDDVDLLGSTVAESIDLVEETLKRQGQ